MDVLDVYAGEPDPPQRGWWDAETGFESSAESMAARKREEETAYGGSLHRVTFLSLLEGQYLDGRRTSADAEAIGRALVAWTELAESGTVALPAGAGRRETWLSRLIGGGEGPAQHRDHLYARDAGLEALAQREVEILLYEELPYLFGRPADDEVRRVAESVRRRAELSVMRVDRDAKARRISAYSSQLPHISPPGRPLDRAESLPAEERYWRLVP